MTYLSDTIKPFDVVLVNNNNDKHYYVCVYTQELDRNNKLDADIYGVVITSNTKYDYLPYNDYNVPMFINAKKVYINCDKLVRIKLRDNVSKKNINIPEKIRKEIRYHIDKFITELKTQTAEEVKL